MSSGRRRAGAAVAPTATYRLQLRQGITLETAREMVDHLARLGVSHLYLSPPFAATEGSTHGYDVTDPNAVDASLGTEDDFRALAARPRPSRRRRRTACSCVRA